MFEGPVQDLIDELGRLPGVGPKSAQRIAFHLLAAVRDASARAQETAAAKLGPLAAGLGGELGGPASGLQLPGS